ncbi:FAD-dependent oxidoreductase [Rhizobium sp. FY34]|uniref:NAD(P)/FAD-dependent oxidoreductase n=1 Tax=Rhizobium sp. FY34 TaxID=2562309 RepID=UPI0010C0618C|nr:FAD-dependent oxidoreductase [Rhizobium sp. FY34]
MQQDNVVIVGAGQAGAELAASLRSLGYLGQITLLGREAQYPYSRPPLSKAYLLGHCGTADLLIRDASMYAQQGVTVRLSVEVDCIDRDAKTVSLKDGETIAYSDLVLATGGSPRRLPNPELANALNVFYIRTLEDVDRLRQRFHSGIRLAIVGGGYIGLEIASVARRAGLEVTLIEATNRVLARVTCPPVSDFFQRIHAEEGVQIKLQSTVSEYVTDAGGDVSALVLGDGERLDVDILVVGIGLIPNTSLAEQAGLGVDNGILVDDYLRTPDPHIYAIGDVARFPDTLSGTLRRIESVPNAAEQARTLAATLLGTPTRFMCIPWFWSDQYDVKMQVVGLSAPDDEVVVRGDVSEGRKLTVYYLRKGVLSAADVVGSPADFAVAKKLIANGAVVDPVLLADPNSNPRSFLKAG